MLLALIVTESTPLNDEKFSSVLSRACRKCHGCRKARTFPFAKRDYTFCAGVLFRQNEFGFSPFYTPSFPSANIPPPSLVETI
jgi:hypothetical protein